MYTELAAVDRTMRILDLLASHPDGMGVTELADRLDLTKANVSRILSTLEAGGYVSQDPRSLLFTLTWRLVAMAYRYADALPLEETAKPILAELATRTGELTQLAVVQNDGMLFVAKVDGNRTLRVASMLGRRAPLHATAVGKVWLASLPEARVMALLDREMKAYTAHTITEPVKLIQELREVAARGYAIVREEINASVAAVAVPVPPDGRPVQAAIVIAVPAFEATPERIEELRAATVNAARDLADRLPPSIR